MRFAMSAFERLPGLARNAPYLWITTPQRALAFLVAFGVVVLPVLVVEAAAPWRRADQLKIQGAIPDNFLRVTRKLAAADRETNNEDIVLIVGGSATREVTPHDRAVSQDLTRLCSRPIRVLNTGTAGQKFAESWAIANAVPAGRLKLIVVGFNYARLREGFEDTHRSLEPSRLPMSGNGELGAFLARHGMRQDIAAPGLFQIAWLRQKLSKAAVSGETEADIGTETDTEILNRAPTATPPDDRYQSEDHQYTPPGKTLVEKKAIAARFLAETTLAFDALHEEATALWRYYTQTFMARGAKVLFLVLPESKVMARTRAILGPRFDLDLGNLQTEGAEVEDWRGNVGLVEEDFYDQAHLLRSGRPKVEQRLIAMIAKRLPGCTQPGSL